MFSEGRKDVKDEDRAGYPSTSTRNKKHWWCEENTLAKPSYSTEFGALFLVLGRAAAFIGMIEIWFHVITINPWFVTNYDPVQQIWVVANRVHQLIRNVNAIMFLVEIELFRYEFRGDPSHAQIIGKNRMARTNRYVFVLSNFSNGDSTIGQYYFLHFINVFSVVGVLWRPAHSSSFTSSRPSENILYHR